MPGAEDKGVKDWGLNAVLLLSGFVTTILKIKNTMVVVVLIFLKHDGLCGRVTVDSTVDIFHNSWLSHK